MTLPKLLLTLASILLLAASHTNAQSVPIRVLCVCQKGDVDGHRMQKALEDSITLSDQFSLSQVAPFDMPKEGIVIEIYSMQIAMKDGHVTGSAMTIEALRPSATERGYFKNLHIEQWMIPTDDAVSDTVLSYLASVRKKLMASK